MPVCVFVCVGVCGCVLMRVCMYVCINARMPDCLVSDQSGTGMKKINNAGTGPVPDRADIVRNFLGPVPDWNYGCRLQCHAITISIESDVGNAHF